MSYTSALNSNSLFIAVLSCSAIEVDNHFTRLFSVASPDETEELELVDECISIDAGSLSVNDILTAVYQKDNEHWKVTRSNGRESILTLYNLTPVIEREDLSMLQMMNYIGSDQDPKDYLMDILSGNYTSNAFYNDVRTYEDED